MPSSYHKKKSVANREAKKLAKRGYDGVFIDKVNIPNVKTKYKVSTKGRKNTRSKVFVTDNTKRGKSFFVKTK